MNFTELPLPTTILIIYLFLVNLVTLFVFGADKLFAQGNFRRIRERTLLILALVGGSLGAILGVKLFRHKTRKDNFGALLGIIILLQLGLIFWLFAPTS